MSSNAEPVTKQYSRQHSTPYRYFRVLRPDEKENKLWPKTSVKEDKCMEELVVEHITFGSKPGYLSPLISLTAELKVALAFAGILSRVAVINPKYLTKDNIMHLDKEYLRSILTDSVARARSKRSDEVVVSGSIDKFCILNIEIKHCERILAPSFHQIDAEFFPSAEDIKNAFTLQKNLGTEMIGGPNKRLFRLTINGRKWIAHPARPNYNLEDEVLFNEELVKLCKHEFACYCLYRHLKPDHVPRCAMYIFDLKPKKINGELDYEENFRWAINLLEDITFEPLGNDKLFLAAQKLYVIDIFLGNWWCVDGHDINTLNESNFYGIRKADNKIVRVTFDRALGCTLPEDLDKIDKKMPIPFKSDNVNDFKCQLQNKHQWLYGNLDQKFIVENIMDLNLDTKFTELKACVDLTQWPELGEKHSNFQKFKEHKKTLWEVLGDRRHKLLNILPFYKLIPLKPGPMARDGHAAVAVNNCMYIIGGNSAKGPLNDCWKLDEKMQWHEMEHMPVNMYSFSADLWKSTNCIVVFGGCTVNKTKQTLCQGDLFLYNIPKNEWSKLPRSETMPEARCRHASTFRDSEKEAEMYIVGGHNGKCKLNDVWKLDFKFNTEANFSCRSLKKLKLGTHRSFSFSLDDRVFSVGGFGRSLMKIEVVYKDCVKNNRILTTLDYLSMVPTKERCMLRESKSLAGFAAVYDETEQRVILIGGGNLTRQQSQCRNNSSGAFGNMRNLIEVFKPRILFLIRKMDSNKQEEWRWETNTLHESLSSSHRLPPSASWSACLINHSIILFGGRRGNDFLKDIYSVQLRPDYVACLEDIKGKANDLEDCMQKYGEKLGCHFREEAQMEVEKIITFKRNGESDMRKQKIREEPGTSECLEDIKEKANDLEDCMQKCGEKWGCHLREETQMEVEKIITFKRNGESNMRKQKLREFKSLNELRIMSLNVHGWSNPDRTRIIDMEIGKTLKSISPDVCCLQEVKQMPAYPIASNHIVRTDPDNRHELLRYTGNESNEDIIDRLVIEEETCELKQFLTDPEVRKEAEYLSKFYRATVKRDDTYISSLEFVAQSILPFAFFKSTIDDTFGNAIISKNIGLFDSCDISVPEAEERNVCRINISHHGPWECAVVNVHLDAGSEEKRIAQFENMRKWLTFNGFDSMPHVLCGDFNTLSSWPKSTPPQRRISNLEHPQFMLYKRLINDGYVDLETNVNGLPRATNIHGTRVDYIFCSRALWPRLDETQLQVIDSSSDHKFLLASLKFHTKKRLFGVTGCRQSGKMQLSKNLNDILSSDYSTAIVHVNAFKRNKQEWQTCIIDNQTFYDQDDKTAYDLNKCAIEVFKQLYDNNIVIIEGPHVNVFLPALDKLYVLQKTDCFKLWKRNNQNQMGSFVASSNLGSDWRQIYWDNIAAKRWKEQLNEVETYNRQQKIKKCETTGNMASDIAQEISNMCK